MLKPDFEAVIADIRAKLIKAPAVPVASWQSMKAPQGMPEILNYSFTLDLPTDLILPVYQEAFRPNLPWADNHFLRERVSGEPINPGQTWKEWPYAASANTHRREGEEDPQFDHSYAERYWPKQAGQSPDGKTGMQSGIPPSFCHRGIRFRYGDLNDLVDLLCQDPLTRQAYLPVWFPEDLAAAVEVKRVPCTLGYHFIRRDDRLHCVYPMRSCDFVRHFRDDVYLTVRLLLWVLQCCRYRVPDTWAVVRPGTFTMHITSLHMFESDRKTLELVAKAGR